MSMDPVRSARSAGLRYVCDDQAGIRRGMGPLGFTYFRSNGTPVRSRSELKRIAALAIPPAWTNVWICPDPRGHLQATGRDARGRKQYRYHPGWRDQRDETKFERMPAFAAALPKIRARTAADLRRAGLPREKVLATVVQLLEKSLIRVGNDEYARANGSVGLTTMRDKHVNVRGSTLRFTFRGKSAIRHAVAVDDRRLARIVKHCRDLPGQELFQYLDDERRRRKVDSGDVNDYLKEITGEDFTAKDFRTWAGTVLACAALKEVEAARETSPRRPRGGEPRLPKHVVQAIDAVAGVLGNTRTVCRKSYIHPAIIGSYLAGTLHPPRARRPAAGRRRFRRGLSAEEAEVVDLLRHAAAESGKKTA